MDRPYYKPENIPGFIFVAYVEKYEYEQLPIFNPNHEYRVIRSERNFIPMAFKDYDSIVKYINQHYPEVEPCPSPFHYYAEEENDIQITSMTEITIQQCYVAE